MKFYITDESNIAKDDKFTFFVYGGLVVDETELNSLCQKLVNIKKSFGVKKERPIKWNNINWNGEGVLDSSVHAKIKELVLSFINKSKCKIIVCLSSQDFYHDTDPTFIEKIKSVINPSRYLRSQKYALNASLIKFNQYLVEMDTRGVVLADMFSQSIKSDMVDHCFSLYPNGNGTSLNRIIFPVVQIDDHYSHIHQINDVVLGAITYSMKEAAYNFLPMVKGNFWMTDDDCSTIFKKGINIYPKTIKTKNLESEIIKLKEKFQRLLGIV